MKTSTSQRLKQLMSERNLKQVDILNLSLPLQKKFNIKMGKSALSQYVNGVQSPDQNRIYLLASTLNVSEPWLMGFDVDRERKPINSLIEETHKEYYTRSKNREVKTPEQVMVDNIQIVTEKLEIERQKKVFDFASEQLEEQKNSFNDLAAHSPDPNKTYTSEKVDEISQRLKEAKNKKKHK